MKYTKALIITVLISIMGCKKTDYTFSTNEITETDINGNLTGNINQNESDIPRINQPTLDRLAELTAEWTALEARGRELLDKELPGMNQRFWELGVGAVWKE